MGGLEQLGIVEDAQKRRETYGRFAYKPPVPGLAKVHRIVVNLKAGTVERDVGVQPVYRGVPAAAEETPADLRRQIAGLRVQLSARERELQELRDKINPRKTFATITSVIEVYCRELAALGYTIDDKPYDASALQERRRSQVYSWPRHVCITLISRLSGTSTSIIGRVFGIDHTTVLHAFWRTPDHLAVQPILAEAHARTLAAFEAQQ